MSTSLVANARKVDMMLTAHFGSHWRSGKRTFGPFRGDVAPVHDRTAGHHRTIARRWCASSGWNDNPRGR